MNNILVTGGGGFIGVNLCKKLLAQGHHVTAIDNFITSNEENSKPLLSNPNFTFINHDITMPFLKSQFSSLNSIYHLACPTGVPNVITLAEEMLLTCSIGTKNVLDLAKEHNAKFLFTSSSEVYGDPEVFPQEETYTGNVNPHGIRSPYEEGKRFSESLVTMYVRKYGLDARIVRIFNTYGQYMSMHDTRVIPHFINQIKNGEPITIYGDGSHKRTFCHVDDLVNGLLIAMEKGTPGEVYNIGSEEEITINDLAKLMLNLVHKNSTNVIPSVAEESSHQTLGENQSLEFKPAQLKRSLHSLRSVGMTHIDNPIEDHRRRLPSLNKIKKLGWEPNISLEEGLKNLIHNLKLEIRN